MPWLPNDPLGLASSDVLLDRFEMGAEPFKVVVETSGQLVLDGADLVDERIAGWGGRPGRKVTGTDGIGCRHLRCGFHDSTSQKTSGVRISGAM